jgi:DNA-binding NarL/FixJ family response regulator
MGGGADSDGRGNKEAVQRVSPEAAETGDPLESGRASFKRRAWSDTCRLLQEADARTPLEARDLEALATAAYLACRDAESEAAWSRAHQAHLERGDREAAAGCALWLAFGLFHRGAAAPGGGWIARAGRLLEEAGHDSVIRGYLLVFDAIRRIDTGDLSGAHATFQQAFAIAQRFADRDLAGLAGHGRGRALIRQGRVADGMTLLDEAMVSVVADEVSPVLAGDIYCSVLEACREVFDWRRAREWTASLTQWCGSQPDLVRYRGECLIYRAEILQLQGDWPEALRDAQQACEQLTSRPGQPALGAAFYRVGEIHRLCGEFNRADDAYRQAAQSGRRPQPGLALLRLARGEAEEAAAALRAVLDDTTERRTRARILPALVEAELARGEGDAARAAATELAEIAAVFDAPVLRAMCAHANGAVQLAQGDARGALAALRDAWTKWRELGMPYEEAQARVLMAMASARLGDTDTRDIETDAARQTFKRLGAAGALTGVAHLSQTSPPPKGAAGLSPREEQVLRLVATGKTNRAIAEELFISEKTVARHVSNIFNKLGVSTRAAATAYAYQRDLI